MKQWAYLFIAMAAFLWGIIGLFVQKLHSFGFSSLQIVSIRVGTAAIILLIFVLIKDKALLRIKPADVKYFIGTGIFSIAFFNWCFFTAIKETSLSVAVILLYTGPAFVTILSRIFFKEWLTKRKIAALLLTLVGCSLVAGILLPQGQTVSLYGLMIGLGSGFGYGLYSIFGKYALAKYPSLTITTYTFIIASLGMLPFSRLWELGPSFNHWEVWAYSIGLGFFPTVLAYILYTIGLAYVESSRASITSTLEPVVATFVGLFVFSEHLSAVQFIGIGLVLMAVILVQESSKSLERNGRVS